MTDEKDGRQDRGKSAQPKKPEPKGWVRWWGLAVFLILVGASAAVWFVFLDHFVKRAIEQAGTRLVGATVELSSADVSLFPLGLTLTGLQVTDPDEPMTNAFEAARIAMTLDGLNLIRRKVIVEEMAVEGVRLGTARKTSGAVSRPVAQGTLAQLAGKVALPSLEVPDIKTIMAGADLQSVTLAESLRIELQTEQNNWKKRLAELPDKAKLNDYKARIERVKASTKGGVAGMLGATGEVAAIQKELERDLANLQGAKADFDRQLASFRQRLDLAVKAPQEDVRRLQERYGFSPQGLANMSGVLLSGQSGVWLGRGLSWYGKVQPVLVRVKEQRQGHEAVKPVRGKGLDVRFREDAPLPDFLIRLATVSLQLEGGDVNGRIESITPDQDVLGKPLTFAFAGEQLKGLRSVRIEGTLNHVVPDRAQDSLRVIARGYEIRDVALSGNSDWPVTLGTAVADLDVQARVTGQALAGTMTAGLRSVHMTLGGQDGAKPFVKAIGSALSDVSAMTAKAEVTGTLDQYEVRVTSDLDQVLKNAAGKLAQDAADRLKKELEGAVMAKAAGPLNDLKSSFGGFGGLGDELTARLAQGAGVTQGTVEKLLPGGFKLPF